MSSKEVLRAEGIKKMKNQSLEEKRERDRFLTESFLSHPLYKEAETVASFLSMDLEFDTRLLIDRALADGKKVYLPKTLPGRQMTFLPYHPDKLKQSPFGVWEPFESGPAISKDQLDLIQVPGVVWDERGYRIGFGGGYYDRYLADYPGATLSLAYGFQKASFKEESFDISVGEVIWSD